MGNENGKPKRKLNDYAGLAALVAAVGAIAFGVMDRSTERAKAERMDRSLFAHSKAQAAKSGGDCGPRVAVLEWRIAQVEKLLEHEHHIEAPPPMAAPLPMRRPARVPASEDHEEDDEVVEMLDSIISDAEDAPPRNISGDVSFDQIQKAVKAGGVYEAKK